MIGEISSFKKTHSRGDLGLYHKIVAFLISSCLLNLYEIRLASAESKVINWVNLSTLTLVHLIREQSKNESNAKFFDRFW